MQMLFRLGRALLRRFENRARLKQAHVVRAAIEVVGQHVEHAGHQRTPHHRCLFALRIRQFDQSRRRKCFRVFMRDKCQRDRFVVTQRQQRSAKLAVFLRVGRLPPPPRRYAGSVLANLSIAMQARDLFDQINFAFHVQAPAGNMDGEIRIAAAFRHQLEAQLLENAENFVGLELLAENAVNFGKMQSHGSQINLPRDRVDRARRPVCLPPIRECSAATRSQALVVASKSAPRSKRCEASVCRPWRREHLADHGGIEPRGFDEDVFRLLRDHGVESAHDSGQRDRFHGVGDDQIFRRQLALHAIERFQGLAG